MIGYDSGSPKTVDVPQCPECGEPMEQHKIFWWTKEWWTCINPDCEEHDGRFIQKGEDSNE